MDEYSHGRQKIFMVEQKAKSEKSWNYLDSDGYCVANGNDKFTN